ncbi:hypothetical protein [uncultured Bacteroides sp.]|uniref:hypothetical protein n=1 Tax=uncultured Bacteroides sp. TaxID=162156 RepID=UPI00280B47A1|nr:hypothetical protein [uncultured Bacteroides sp.]
MGYKKTTLTFRQAVENTPEIKNGFHNGLQALGANAKQVSATDTKKLEGSVDIDECTKALYPNDARWDYAIGYEGKVYFLEIHPASTSNVKDMIKKAEWLTNWLMKKAPSLKSLTANNTFYWKASGRQDILPRSPQYRKLIQSRIQLVSNFRLPIT